MKKTLTSLLVSTVLIGGCMAMIASQAPSQAQASSRVQSQRPVIQTLLEDVHLTEAQKQQILSLRQSTRSQIASILTPQQQSQIPELLGLEGSLRDRIAALDLTDSQRQNIRSILYSSGQQLQSILSSEQRGQVRQNLIKQWKNP